MISPCVVLPLAIIAGNTALHLLLVYHSSGSEPKTKGLFSWFCAIIMLLKF
jgi:hypothetical protein